MTPPRHVPDHKADTACSHHATRRTLNPPSEAPSTPTRLPRVGPHRPPSEAPSTPTGFQWEKATSCGSMVGQSWAAGLAVSAHRPAALDTLPQLTRIFAPHVYRFLLMPRGVMISCMRAILRPSCCFLFRSIVSQGLLQSSRPRHDEHPCQTQSFFESRICMGLCKSRLHGARDTVVQDHTQLPMAARWTESYGQQRVECYVPHVLLCLTHITLPCHW